MARLRPFLLATIIALLALAAVWASNVSAGPAPQGLPTATLAPNTYHNQEEGVRVTYPKGWTTQDGKDSGGLQWFISPDGSVRAILYASSGGTLEEAGKQARSDTFDPLQDVTILSDGQTALANGDPAWQTVGTATVNGSQLKVGVTTALHDGRGYSILAFGPAAAFDAQAAKLDSLAKSMAFDAGMVQGLPRDQALVLAGGESTNPRDYDPATTYSAGDKKIFSGLVSLDPQMRLTPEIAESWEVKDGTVYTFHLRDTARFHDGRPVTAQDFVYSWERAAAPTTGSNTVMTYLGDIVGIKDMHEGKAEHISGLKALDDHTLQVTIDAPKPYFLLKLTYPTAFVVDKANVESGADWYRKPNGTGPYKLLRWDPFKVMVYQRNDAFYLGAPAIPYIVVQLYSGVPMSMYETGGVDIAGVPSYDVARVSDPGDPLNKDVRSGVDLCTDYVVFDVAQPPFDDPKVRQAFTMAFDRQKYIDVVTSGVALPAEGLYPPALPGHNPGLKPIPYDPAKARELLAQSKYGGPGGLPPIVYSTVGFGSGISPDVAALVEMWHDNLGVDVTVENLEPNHYQDEIFAGRHGQIFGGGWCADYPDPENFADALFHTGAQQNNGHYSNPQLDALLEQARVEPEVAKRIALYQQAEQIIVDDAPVLFTTHGLSYVLVKPYVKGYELTPISIPIERYMSLEH